MPRVPLADWQAEQYRLTVFPMPDAIARAPSWWEEIAEAPPDETTANPKRGSGSVTGAIDAGKLLLRLEPDRIDWVLAPQDLDVSALSAPQFPSVGPFIDSLDVFSSIAEKWLAREDIPAIGRMAFGAVGVHPEADRTAGYLRLPEYVPVRVDPASSDFLYQINLPPVPSATGIEGLQLNRLSKWSVASFRLVALRFVVGAGVGHASQFVPQASALRVELDINTAFTFSGPIPQPRLVEVYRELAAAGREIVINGVSPQ
jgi:hypothetical protein